MNIYHERLKELLEEIKAERQEIQSLQVRLLNNQQSFILLWQYLEADGNTSGAEEIWREYQDSLKTSTSQPTGVNRTGLSARMVEILFYGNGVKIPDMVKILKSEGIIESRNVVDSMLSKFVNVRGWAERRDGLYYLTEKGKSRAQKNMFTAKAG